MPKEKRSYVTVIHYLNDDGTEMSEEQKTLYLKEKEEIKRKKEEDYKERFKLQEYENSIKGKIKLKKRTKMMDKMSAYVTKVTYRRKPKMSPVKVQKGLASAYTLTSNKFTSASIVQK